MNTSRRVCTRNREKVIAPDIKIGSGEIKGIVSMDRSSIQHHPPHKPSAHASGSRRRAEDGRGKRG